MTGVPDFNFPLFNSVAEQLRRNGMIVVNPAENFGGDTTLPRWKYLHEGITQLLTCDNIYLLPGWSRSPGARLELAVAKACDMTITGAVNERDEFRDELEQIITLHDAKRSDYTAGSVDLLANYRFSSGMVGLSVERGMFMRMAEKIYRIKSLFEKGGQAEVKDESMTDTLRDIAIISILMKLSLQGGMYGLGDSNGKERDS